MIDKLKINYIVLLAVFIIGLVFGALVIPRGSNTDALMNKIKVLQDENREMKKALGIKKETNITRLIKQMGSAPSGWPLRGRIMSSFGYRLTPWRGFHSGLDIDAPYGAPVKSTAAGVVSYVGWRTGYGRVVEIRHPSGLSTFFAHLSAAMVKAGTKVNRGQTVALVGTTGFSTGAHLHYEVRKWDASVDPFGFLDLNIVTASKHL